MNKKINQIIFFILLIPNLFANKYINEFNLQQFLQSDSFMDTIKHNDSIFGQLRLFTAEKANSTPFNNFDVNEADHFFVGGSNGGFYFDRQYNITHKSKDNWLNFELPVYAIAIYPIKDALSKVINECDLHDEPLTTLGINHPATLYDSIVYIFTNQNNYGSCAQSLFDTRTKMVYCKVMRASCYINPKTT